MRSVNTFTKTEIEKLQELSTLLKRGALPAYLLNPEILIEHNNVSPQVARLHETSEVHLNSLITLVAGTPRLGVEARSSTKRMLSMASKENSSPSVLDPAMDDPKLHRLLDEKEKENDSL